MTLGTVSLNTRSTALRFRSMLKIVTAQRRNDKASLALYYTGYYEPLFPTSFPGLGMELFARSAIEDGLISMVQTPDSAPLSELRVILDLAKEVHELIWTLTTIVADLNAFLRQKSVVVEILQTVFSNRSHPECLPPENHIDQLFTRNSRPCSYLRKPRFDTNSIIGQRLAQNLELWSHLAKLSGLLNKAFSLSNVRPQPLNKSEIVSYLYALLQQTWPWTINMMSLYNIGLPADLAEKRFRSQIIDGKTVAGPIIVFGEVIRGLGVNMTIQKNRAVESHPEMISYLLEVHEVSHSAVLLL